MKKLASNIKEQELVTLLCKRDKQAMSILYDRYATALLGVIFKIIGDREIAEDVLQETFYKIWTKIVQYNRAKGTLFTWMLNIARYAAIDKVRSKQFKKAQKIQTLENTVSTIERKNTITPNIDVIGLKGLVKELKPEYQQVIELLYFKGYTQVEAAKDLQIPLGTVKTRIRAAINHLRKITA